MLFTFKAEYIYISSSQKFLCSILLTHWVRSRGKVKRENHCYSFFCFLLCFFFIFRHRNLHTSLYIWIRKTYSNIIFNFSRVLYQKQHIRMNGKRLFCYVKCGLRIFGVYSLVQDTIVKQRLPSWSPDVKANQKWFNLCSVLLFLLVLSDLVFDKVRHLKEC